MIISASRRTDIPAFYSDWFYNRIKAGFVDVRNPMNIHQISRINLSPKGIDCIVFWSKNPTPMLKRIDELNEYKYYFQFTINPYDTSLERFVPLKRNVISAFKDLSNKIGRSRVIWRYDPILISNEITIKYHINYFEELAKRLEGYSSFCVISFIDLYKKTLLNTKNTTIRELDEKEMREVASSFSLIASKYGFEVKSCAEVIDLSHEGILHGKCIDDILIKDIVGYSLKINKDQNQREECGCVQSIDIGEYNTCMHNCIYCYANYNHNIVSKKFSYHDKESSLLIGKLEKNDMIKERLIYSLKNNDLFEL